MADHHTYNKVRKDNAALDNISATEWRLEYDVDKIDAVRCCTR